MVIRPSIELQDPTSGFVNVVDPAIHAAGDLNHHLDALARRNQRHGGGLGKSEVLSCLRTVLHAVDSSDADQCDRIAKHLYRRIWFLAKRAAENLDE